MTRGDTTPTFNASTYGLLTGALDNYDTVIIDTAPCASEWTRHADTRVLVTDRATSPYATQPDNADPTTSSSSPNPAEHSTTPTSKP